MLVFCGVFFLAAYFRDPNHVLQHRTFWIAFADAVILTLVIDVSSYRKDRRRYSAKEVRSVARTMSSVRFMDKTFWIWFLPIVGINFFTFRHIDSTALMGAAVGLFVCISLSMLIDNLFTLGMFGWNSRDPKIRKLIVPTRQR